MLEMRSCDRPTRRPSSVCDQPRCWRSARNAGPSWPLTRMALDMASSDPNYSFCIPVEEYSGIVLIRTDRESAVSSKRRQQGARLLDPLGAAEQQIGRLGFGLVEAAGRAVEAAGH